MADKSKESKAVIDDDSSGQNTDIRQKTSKLIAVIIVLSFIGGLLLVDKVSNFIINRTKNNEIVIIDNDKQDEVVPCPSPEPKPEPEPIPSPNPDYRVPVLDGPESQLVGRIAVFSLAGADNGSWSVVPDCQYYYDERNQTIIFSSEVEGDYTVFASAVKNDIPYALVKHINFYSDGKNDKNVKPDNDKTDNDGDKEKDSGNIGEWIKNNIPADGKGQYADVADICALTAKRIESGIIVKDDAAWGFARGQLKGICDAKIWDGFLDGLANKMKEESNGGEINALKDCFLNAETSIRSVMSVQDTEIDEKEALKQEIVEQVKEEEKAESKKKQASTCTSCQPRYGWWGR